MPQNIRFLFYLMVILLVQNCDSMQRRAHIPEDKYVTVIQAHWRETCYEKGSSCPDGKGASLLGASFDRPFYKFNQDGKKYYPELAYKLAALAAPVSDIRGGIDLELAPQIRYNIFNAFLFWLSPAFIYNPRTAHHEMYVATKVGLTFVANSDVPKGEEPFTPRVAYSFETKIANTRVRGVEPMPMGFQWQLGVGFAW